MKDWTYTLSNYSFFLAVSCNIKSNYSLYIGNNLQVDCCSIPQLAAQQQAGKTWRWRGWIPDCEWGRATAQALMMPSTAAALSTCPFPPSASGLRARGGLEQPPVTQTGQMHVGILSGKQRHSVCVCQSIYFPVGSFYCPHSLHGVTLWVIQWNQKVYFSLKNLDDLKDILVHTNKKI